MRKIAILAVSFFILFGSVFAYDKTGYFWDYSDVPVYYDIENSIPSSWESEIVSADSSWDDAANYFWYNWDYYDDYSPDNSLTYGSIDGLGGTAAETTTYYYWLNDINGTTIDKADIKFDSDNVWSTSGASGAVDVQSVAAHEFGHALGLNHSSVTGATMEPNVSLGDTSHRSLEPDDIAGVNDIYD